MSIYDAAMKYRSAKVATIVLAGKEYGTGSSRDWAAKGPYLLGVRAVIAESFERIHRSNLVGMGVLPLQFKDGATRKTIGLDGSERVSIAGIAQGLKPRATLELVIRRADGRIDKVPVTCRIDTADELDYFRHGGILHYVLRGIAEAA
jgi:aconitate hydratase